ncbi:MULTISPECIES: hypothetical protein [Listeria]|uniref:hypothetical protein n=1 Tax=Listeria TaxID=1637 RepID=UPI000B59165D|nr:MULTISPECIES: hypothetical protein [Listeria]
MNYLADLEEAYALGCHDARIIAVLDRVILSAGVYQDQAAILEAQSLLFEAATCQQLRAKQLQAYEWLRAEYQDGNPEIDYDELTKKLNTRHFSTS